MITESTKYFIFRDDTGHAKVLKNLGVKISWDFSIDIDAL